MQCKGEYYNMVDGKLTCDACGKTPEEHREKIEDKMIKKTETKTGPVKTKSK